MNTNKQRILIISLLFVLVAGCGAYATIDLPLRAESQETYLYEGSVERGALLYANNCRTCHGNQGHGGVGPPLNLEEWRDQDPVVLEENRAILTRTLQCGRAGTLMPAWLAENGGALNERQIEQLVNFLTQPAEEDLLDERDNPTSPGWIEALEFAHNLNSEIVPLVSGDTLSSIADGHLIGVQLLAEANGVAMEDVDQPIERGSDVIIPPNSDYPDGYEYRVRSDNDTIAKLASTLNVGAAVIADLNNIPIEVDYANGTITILDEEGNPLPGLLPGETLELPEGAAYQVIAGDTLESIAERHNITVDEIRELNEPLVEAVEDSDEFDGFRRLELPDSATITVAEGDTFESLATIYSVDAGDLAEANDLTEDAVLEAGTQLEIPLDARYVVQELDTIDSIAEAHGVSVDELVELNALEDISQFSHLLILQLPKVDAYVIQGQTIADVAGDYGNVTPESFAAANGVDVDEVLRVGTELVVPEDSFGTAPPDAINQGTGCVQYAVPQSIYQTIVGETTGPEEAPEEFTDELLVLAHANDWTFVADSEEMTPNEGVVKVRPNTTVTFENVEPIPHTITIDGETIVNPFGPAEGETYEFTFSDEGEYYLTCDFHPDMVGWIFVEEE